MATKQGSSVSGKLGNKIYYTWHGRQCERSLPTHVTNPQTEAQQSHRNAFAMVSKLSSYMKEAHLVGLHWQAVREKNSTYAVFKHLNKDCLTPDGAIDLSRIIVSRGTLPPVDIVSACIDGNVLTITFDSQAYNGNATDNLFLFVYCPTLCTGALSLPIPRSDGLASLLLPEEWLQPADTTPPIQQSDPQAIHLYAFLRGNRGRTSDTIHLSIATTSTAN